MDKVLGIDLGTNSIGWAIRDLNEVENQIIDKGVLTFDKGVAEDKSGEHPMVQKRTNARGIRRNYQAEKYRKWELLKTLIENEMCPLTIDELNEWRHYKKGAGRKYPQSEKFVQWLRFDFDGDGKPDFERLGFSKHESYYLFRSLIIDETKKDIFKKEPLIIGRIMYLLVQRRGYNDGSEIDEIEQNELSKTIKKGGGDAGALGSDEIQPLIEKYKTLGAALYHIQKDQKVRIRKRYNLRSKFDAELKEICRVQDIEHLYKLFWKAIIWQRPLRGQKGLVGICTFETNKRRCPISHPLYEEYRTWVFINNLKIKPIDENEGCTEKLQNILHSIVYPEFYKAASDFKLSSIKKKLEKTGYLITGKFPDDTKVNSMHFLYRMKEIFGDKWQGELGWHNFMANEPKTVKYNIEDLWHLHFSKTTNKNTGENSINFLQRFAIEKLSLDEDKSKSFAKTQTQQGYATLSLNAIKKILPYLQKGHIYSEAVYLANLQQVLGAKEISETDLEHFSKEIKKIFQEDKVQKKYIQAVNELISAQLNAEPNTRFGMDSAYQLVKSDVTDIENKLVSIFGNTSWDRLPETEKQAALTFVSNKYLGFLQKRIYAKDVFEKPLRIHDRIFTWISESYGIPDENKKYLWHPSEQETYKLAPERNGVKFLGSPEPISKGFKNPMALKTLYRLKKLINYLIEVKKIDEDTRIVVEIARELNDANKREAIKHWQRNRETENIEFAKAIIGTAKIKYPNLDEKNPEVIHKFRLWFEQTENSAETWKQITGLKDDVKKLRLWQEQKGICLYTGKSISISELFNGSKYDFEHTIPASMSFDNELKNLTIADKTYNQQIKSKKLPSECPNFDNDALGFSAIVPRIEFMRKKVEELEAKYERAIYFSKKSLTKEDKDKNIQEKHYVKINLDYWRYKLQSFTITEYKAGWRNSQLRDTQTITKYALPFLKTVFKKVEVQKGNITADFRKILKIQPRLEKKERTKHSHHAIDAAVLTLIPSASIRDKILLKYNEANENNINYHETPRQWTNFKTAHILNIENETLINYLPDHRTLTSTIKNVRKRGKIQFVKEKLSDGKWQYKTNEKGEKIPLVAKGDSIRGQLHKDSFFGAIKSGDEVILVERYPISAFTSIADCKHIIDAKVRELVHDELQKRMEAGLSFEKAKLEPVPFHKGTEVIKKVRCRVLAGAGYLRHSKALAIHKHDTMSSKEYKQNIYAQNDTNIFCLYYEGVSKGSLIKAFKIVGLFEIAQIGIKVESDLFRENYFNSIKTGKGKNESQLPLFHILQVGTKCIFYHENLDELKEIDTVSLLSRLFRIYKFNEMGTPNLFLQNHLEARKNELLDDGDTSFDRSKKQYRLKIKASKFNCAIEGKHFDIKPDGEIKWLF